MTSHLPQRSFWFATTCLVAVVWSVSTLDAQTPGQLPENWRQLPADEFVTEANKFYDHDADMLVGNIDRAGVGARAAELLANIDVQNAATDQFHKIASLYRIGRHDIDDPRKEAMRTALLARQDNWAGRPYVEMREKVTLMDWLDLPFQLRSQNVTSWITSGGDLTEVWDEDLPYLDFYVLNDAKAITGSFAVQWVGRLVPPQTGQYTFSISPINVNGTHRDYHVRETMTVSVGGNVVLTATPENWVSQSAPVQLTADQPVDLEVNLSVESGTLPNFALHALLFWEGPGIAKSTIPEARLKLPNSDDQGLRATYRWKVNGEELVHVQIDPTIDFAWTSGTVRLGSDSSQPPVDAQAVWQKLMSADYLNSLLNPGGKPKLHPFLNAPEMKSETLSSEQRQAFLDELLNRPELLDAMNPEQAVDAYRALRMGAGKTALDVFGRWAARHPNSEAGLPYETFAPGFDLDNREKYMELAGCVTQELPQEVARLQQEYLELPDGTCVLPVAYTLAYSYLGRGKLNEWIDLLAAKLADPAITGDKRVNWLLARAQADEIRLGPAEPWVIVRLRVMDGYEWVTEAALVAESAEAKVRVAKEKAARLAALRKFDEARDLLQQASEAAPAELQPQVADWKKGVDAFEAANAKAAVDQEALAKQTYIDTLKARRDQASSSGDTEAVARYDGLIDAAGAAP